MNHTNSAPAPTPAGEPNLGPGAERDVDSPTANRYLETSLAGQPSSHPKPSQWVGFFWGLQVATLVGLAVVAFLLFSSSRQLAILENRSIQTEERLARQSTTVPDTTRLIETLATLTQVLERTNQQYDAERAEHRALKERVAAETSSEESDEPNPGDLTATRSDSAAKK